MSEINSCFDDEITSESEEHFNDVIKELLPEDEFDQLQNDFVIEFNENYETTAKTLSNSSILVMWLCLFLALWQYTFNITDTALEKLFSFFKNFS